MKPFVKRAGGKRQILEKINNFIDDSIQGKDSYRYLEPFVGGGAVFFSRAPKNAIINDLNEDLINAYRVIKSKEYGELIKLLQEHDINYKQDPDGYFYEVRSWDRLPNWQRNKTDIERAARMIFLNRTCYNGLYRVNNKGQFNTPIGRYKNPTICDIENIVEIHNYLSSPKNNIQILDGSYEQVLDFAIDNDVVYLDPPYDYEDDDGFTKYQIDGFSFDDLKKMKAECDKIIDRGATAIISNNATEKVLKLFEEDPSYKIYYDVNKFKTLRNINCKGERRRSGLEVIFWGMNNFVPFPQANDLNKIIDLMMSEEDVLSDKEKAMRLIHVDTPRQVAYYFSALKFFKYISQNNKLTDLGKALKGNKYEIYNDIYHQLMEKDIFKKFYDDAKSGIKLDTKNIFLYLKKNNSQLSDSTLERRASTIKSRVTWMEYINLSDEFDSKMK